MARTEKVLDNRNTTGDVRTIGPVTLTKALKMAALVLDRTGFTDTTAAFSLRAEYRESEKAPWQTWCGIGTRGGPTSDPTSVSTSFVPPIGSQVQILVRTNGKTVRQALSFIEED